METREHTGSDDLDPRDAPEASAAGWARTLSLPLSLLGVLAAVALVARTAIPVDETRYLSVAWEMWRSGDFLVPHLNGVAYSHKPPLLFWLIHSGWALFGVVEWWPRLVPALCLAGSLVLTVALGRQLWPERQDLARRGAMVLQGIFLFAVLATYLLFDPLLVACTLVALLGVARAAGGGRGGGARAWALAGLGIGLGILAKGPVILLHVLPVALAGPFWVAGGSAGPGPTGSAPTAAASAAAAGSRPGPGRWYGGVALAVLLGAAIGLAWAVPAALAGGPEYARAIFLGQTAGRLSESFAHRRPVWWYLPLLPVILSPYGVWPPLYRAVFRLIRRESGRMRSVLGEPGVRFALVQVVPALVIFSLISGKQPQYLAPLFPALALLVARLLELAPAPRRWEVAVPFLLPLIVAVALLLLPLTASRDDVPDWASLISPGAGALFGAVLILVLVHLVRRGGGAAGAARPGSFERPLAVLSVALVATLYLGLAPMFAARYDLEPMARFVRVVESRGGAVAHVGEYRGELHFLGRLERPFEEIESDEAPGWLAAHPGGAVLAHYDQPSAGPRSGFAGSTDGGAADLSGAAFVQPIRSKTLAVWTGGGAYRRP